MSSVTISSYCPSSPLPSKVIAFLAVERKGEFGRVAVGYLEASNATAEAVGVDTACYAAIDHPRSVVIGDRIAAVDRGSLLGRSLRPSARCQPKADRVLTFSPLTTNKFGVVTWSSGTDRLSISTESEPSVCSCSNAVIPPEKSYSSV